MGAEEQEHTHPAATKTTKKAHTQKDVWTKQEKALKHPTHLVQSDQESGKDSNPVN